MSDNGEHRDSERAGTVSKWVWRSTEESVKHGAISVWACGEVAVGIWLYWWFIPWWFETNLHLLISVGVVPFLLLRSPESMESALTAFCQFYEGEEFPLLSKWGVVAVLLAAGLSAPVSWGLAETWLNEHDGWSLFWRAGIMGWISMLIGIVVTTTTAAALVGRGTGRGTGTAAVALAGAGTGALVGALVGAVTGAVALAACRT